jgi:hypothetical protein
MELTEEQIRFLNDVCSGKWILDENGEVYVDSSVDMSGGMFTEIPVKFGKVEGYFNCSRNNLTTLENCPTYVGGGFIVGGNNLTDYFKSIKEEEFPHWDKLRWSWMLEEYPFLINIVKKYKIVDALKIYLKHYPLTKLYYKD